MTGTGPRPGAGSGVRTGLGQSCSPRAPEAQVDTWDQEEDAVHVTSQQTFTTAHPGHVPRTDKGSPNPGCISSLCGARCPNAQRRSCTAQGSRESRHDPESGGGIMPVGFKAAGDLSLVCGHQVSYPKDVHGSGRNRLPPVSGQCWTPLHLLGSLKQRFFHKPGS